MRLKDIDKAAIDNIFRDVFVHGELYLFGSRVDDTRKGGDIDIYIVPASQDELVSKKIEFLVLLKKIIDDQKIDVVIDRGKNRLIDRVARKTGVLICKY
jgi:predicted nucleotidyltransferase